MLLVFLFPAPRLFRCANRQIQSAGSSSWHVDLVTVFVRNLRIINLNICIPLAQSRCANWCLFCLHKQIFHELWACLKSTQKIFKVPPPPVLQWPHRREESEASWPLRTLRNFFFLARSVAFGAGLPRSGCDSLWQYLFISSSPHCTYHLSLLISWLASD
jgi:hypothetical protein